MNSVLYEAEITGRPDCCQVDARVIFCPPDLHFMVQAKWSDANARTILRPDGSSEVLLIVDVRSKLEFAEPRYIPPYRKAEAGQMWVAAAKLDELYRHLKTPPRSVRRQAARRSKP